MKTYIMTLSDPTVQFYDELVYKTTRAIESCRQFGIEYELIFGPTPTNGMAPMIADLLGVRLPPYFPHKEGGCTCCNLSHAMGYKRIGEGTETAVLMEYDGYWVKPPPSLPSEGNQIFHICNSKWAEGFALTPEAGRYFLKYRQEQDYIDGITDHTTQYQLRVGSGITKQWHDKLMVPQFHRMQGYIDGNENANADPKTGQRHSIRRSTNGEFNLASRSR